MKKFKMTTTDRYGKSSTQTIYAACLEDTWDIVNKLGPSVVTVTVEEA